MTTKILQAKAIISAEDKTGAVLASIGRKLKDLGKGAKVSAEVDRLTKSLGKAHSQMRAIDQFRGAQSGFIAARDKFRQTQAAVEAAARAMAAAERPTRALQSALASAQRDVSRAAAAYDRHKDAILGAKRAMEGMGVPTKGVAAQQAKLRSSIDTTSAALLRQEARAERRASQRQALGNLTALGGVYAGHKAKELGYRAIGSAAEFDIAVRRQRMYNDVSTSDQGGLIAQAKRIGQETPYSNTDVVKAQTASMQGLPASFSSAQKAQVAQGITENVKNLAVLLEKPMQEASETLRSYLQTAGKDISSGPKATTEANKAVNQMVRMQKLGGMSSEDVPQYLKYAMGAATAANLSPETAMSLAAIAKRGGLRGDESGVFIRSAAGKLVSPTRGGLAALTAAGINYSDYRGAPKSLNVGRLESQFQNQLGTSFSPGVRSRLAGMLNDPAVLKSQEAFTAAVTSAVGPDFAQKLGGGMKAADKSKIARSAGQFYRLSSGNVDTERLLGDIMGSRMPLAALNEFFTSKHGGKAAITSQQRDEYNATRGKIGEAGRDPEMAARMVKEIMGGLGGSLENLKGSWQNLLLGAGTSNEGPLKYIFDKLGAGLDKISDLPQPAQQAATALGLVATSGYAAAGALSLAGAVLGFKAGKSILGGVGRAASSLLGGGAAPAGAGAGIGAGAAGGGAMAGLLAAGRAVAGPVGLVGGLGAMVKGTADAYGYRPASGPGSGAYGKALRSSLDEQYGTSRGGVSASGSGGAGGKVEAVVSGPVTATLTGSATVEGSTKIEVVVSASSELLSAVASAKSASAALKGSLNAGGGNGPGSTGRSSPDAAAGGTGRH